MVDISSLNTHELFVWDADELLAAVKTKVRSGVDAALAANDLLKEHLDADVVALTQFLQSSSKIARQIKLLGIFGRAYVKELKGKRYIIFKGDARLRPNLLGTRYAVENIKVRSFVVGDVGILEDVVKGTKVAVIAFVVIDIITEVMSDHFSVASLGVRIASDLLQVALSAGAGAAAGAFLATTVGAPVVVAFIVVVAVGFAVGVALTELDRRFRMTERARARMMAVEQQLQVEMTSIKRRIGRDMVVVRQQARQDISFVRQKAFQIGRRSAEVERNAVRTIKAEAYKVDRYFVSLSEMLLHESLALLQDARR